MSHPLEYSWKLLRIFENGGVEPLTTLIFAETAERNYNLKFIVRSQFLLLMVLRRRLARIVWQHVTEEVLGRKEEY